jgi:tetratricopeptide (TPR) repeat protein
VSNALVSTCTYVAKTFWPTELHAFYQHPRSVSPWLAIAAGSSLAAALSAAYIRRTKAPYFLAGMLWFGISLLPVIGLIQVGGQARADRYSYLPLIGIFVAVVWSVAAWAKPARWRRLAAVAVGVAALASLVLGAGTQLAFWKDSETLWRRVLAIEPNNLVAHNNLGMALVDVGRLREAAAHYRFAIALNPSLAKPHLNLGNVLLDLKRAAEARRCFSRALALDPSDAVAYQGLGAALCALGRSDEAQGYLRHALRLQPELSLARRELERTLSKGTTDLSSSIDFPLGVPDGGRAGFPTTLGP